jgi:nicotinamide-nucleotide amidase
MKAEIISIGTELTSGQSLDTNCQWLSQRLAEMGILVGWHTTVADDLDDDIEAFRVASSRAELVLATGGLGPTQDDLTRDVLARLAGVDLMLDPASLQHIEQMFARFRRPMPERNRVQALLPKGAEAIPNANGTAPGILMRVGECLFVALPGVPSEMMAMFETEVKPRLGRLGIGGGVLVERRINCFGAGESAVEQKLLEFTDRSHVPKVGITVSDATISLRILAHAATPAEAQKLIQPVEQVIRERLGPLVFGDGEEDLQHVVGRILAERGFTVATAESVTGGLVAHRLSQVPGASNWLRGGVVSYTDEVKSQWLGVPGTLIQEHGAVSAEVVQAMAVGCRDRFRTDFAVSTSGLAGPDGGTPEKPIGLVYAGLAWEGGVSCQSFNWAGARTQIQSRTAKLALNQLRLHLLRAGRA